MTYFRLSDIQKSECGAHENLLPFICLCLLRKLVVDWQAKTYSSTGVCHKSFNQSQLRIVLTLAGGMEWIYSVACEQKVKYQIVSVARN